MSNAPNLTARLTFNESIAALPYFSAALLKITQKLGGIVNLRFKPLQYRIHAAVERLMYEREEVRLIVVKPRQIRASTYFQALNFQQLYDFPGTQSLTITHRVSTTDELFGTLKRYQDFMPPDLKIPAKKDNDEVLYLTNESKAKVATAGSDAARGFPCRMLLISELGRMRRRQVADIQEGALQTLATGPGSIGIIESTSGGSGDYFHELAKLGLQPKSRWRTLFFSWTEEPEYRLTPPGDWSPDDEERELAKAFNLTHEQLYWRYDKIMSEFQGLVSAFNREYPLTFDMAFEEAGNRLLDSVAIFAARKKDPVRNMAMPVIMGVDPAGKGDRTVIVLRQGDCIFKHYIWRKMDDAALTGIVNRLIDEHSVRRVFIDNGYGHGVVSHLRDLGRYNVVGVHFGAAPSRSELFGNMRAEMAATFKDWLHEGPNGRGGVVSIPDDDEFCDDLKAIPEFESRGTRGLLYLPTKDEIKKELGKSTDCFDAACLTFAYPVAPVADQAITIQPPKHSILTTKTAFDSVTEMSSYDVWPSYGVF